MLISPRFYEPEGTRQRHLARFALPPAGHPHTTPPKRRRRERWTPFGSSSPDWVFALIAASPSGVHSPRAVADPLRSVLRLSQPLDGLLRHSAHRLVSSCSHVQGSVTVQGLLPPRSRARLVGEPCPHVVVAVCAHPSKLELPPRPRLDFEAFIRARSRRSPPGFSRRRTRSPLRVPLSPGLLRPSAAAYPLPSTHGVSRPDLRRTARRIHAPPAYIQGTCR
jgi:hypothetical protein